MWEVREGMRIFEDVGKDDEEEEEEWEGVNVTHVDDSSDSDSDDEAFYALVERVKAKDAAKSGT